MLSCYIRLCAFILYRVHLCVRLDVDVQRPLLGYIHIISFGVSASYMMVDAQFRMLNTFRSKLASSYRILKG